MTNKKPKGLKCLKIIRKMIEGIKHSKSLAIIMVRTKDYVGECRRKKNRRCGIRRESDNK